jgi:subfamily B ATP-binding cassette protein MsbA
MPQDNSSPRRVEGSLPGPVRPVPNLLGRLLREAVRPYAGLLAAAVFCMVLFAAASGVSVLLLRPVIDQVFINHDHALLWLISGAVFASYLVRSLASYGQDTLMSSMGQRIIADMQIRLFRHVIRHDPTLFQERNTGLLVSQFTFDVNAMRSAVSNAIVAIGRDSLSVVCLVGVMVYQDWVLTLVSLVVAPATILPLQMLGRRMRRGAARIQAEYGNLNVSLSQTFQGIRVVKAFGMETFEIARFEDLAHRVMHLVQRNARISAATQPIVDVAGGLAVAAIIVFDGSRVIEGTTTTGAFFSFVAAVITAYQPMRSLAKVGPTMQEGLAAAERLYALLDRPPLLVDPPDAKALPRIAGEVRFDHVTFHYETTARAALDAVDFAAPAGRVTALVGPSGAGKTTIFSLLPRFYDPQAGVVRINGEDIRGVTLASLRDTLAIVGQDVMLFDDNIANNIRYGRPGASDAEVIEAARAAAADGFIRALPAGYQTMVGERGLKLSGGQRQRIAIARALLKDAPILLLDEATSALDTESERLIQEALDRLMAGRTTLVIAHRLSTIQHADRILVLDQGKVVEAGNHDSLLGAGGLYARLHALQFRETGGEG